MNSLLDSTGLWLHSVIALSWKGALLALLVGILIVLFRRRLTPAWRHTLWLLVLARLAMPDIATSDWSLSRWLALPQPAPVEIVTVPLSAPSPMIESEAPLTETAFPEVSPSLPMEPAVSSPPPAPATPWTSWQWLTLVWLLGMGGVIAAMTALHARMLLRVRRDRTEPPPKAMAILRAACERANVKRVPRLIVTNAVRAPALFGMVRPVILLPKDLAASYDPASLNLILLHELAHLQRRDLWSQVAAALIIAVHWFNPAAWWAARRLRAEAEMAADARALRHAKEEGEAHRLGEVLLGFANRAATGWMTWFAAATVLGISENKRDLRHRIEALTDLARGRKTWRMMGAALLALLVQTGFTQAPAEASQDTQAETASGISGIVVDDRGNPVAGAACSLSSRSAQDGNFQRQEVTSDQEGRFAFAPVDDGTEAWLYTTHPDFLNAKPVTLIVRADKLAGHRIALTPAASWLTGKVTRKAGGSPVAGAVVYLGSDFAIRDGDSRTAAYFIRTPSRTATTDASGSYRLANWSDDPKKALLVIDAPGMALETVKLTWEDADPVLTHELEPAEEVTGRVVNDQGQPVSGAVVDLTPRSYWLRLNNNPISSLNALSSHWVGSLVTDENGEFRGKPANRTAMEKLYLIVHHPSEGYQHVRLTTWESGGTMQLSRWSSIQGQLLDEKGDPMPNEEIQFNQSCSEREPPGALFFHVSNNLTCKTDEQGRYRLDRVIPKPGHHFIRVREKPVGMNRGPFHAGETLEANLRLPAPKLEASAENSRTVKGRIIPPAGHSLRSDQYKIRINIQRAGNVGAHPLDEPDAVTGRFESTFLPPGDYTLRVWVQPTDDQWRSDFDRGFSLPFKLEPNAKEKSLDLGELKLEAADFVFRPAAATSRSPSGRKVQQLDLPVAEAASFTTWAGSEGNGVSRERPFTAEGRIAGAVVLSSNRHFLLRATKADGSRFYSPVQTGLEDLEQPFEKEISFSPGVTVEGQLRDLPTGDATGGWVAAAVRVEAQTEPGRVRKGGVPSLTWHAWTPATREGRFRFKSLPRGSLTLVGFGEGWMTQNANGSDPGIQANLLEAESSVEITAGTERSQTKRVQLLRPDGSPASGATISVASLSNTHLNRAWNRSGHAVEPEDAEAYARYKGQSIPGHTATADAEGHATLHNLLYQPYGQTLCQASWTDPQTGAKHEEKATLQFESNEVQIIRLTETRD